MLTITEERPALSSITAETAGGLHHIWDVVRRWWVLLVLGTVAAVAVGAGAISASKTHYAADAEVAVDQPAQTLEPGGLPAAQRMAQYINTFSELAVSDKVLDGVRAELGYNLSIEDLRAHVSSAVVLNSVVLKFHTDFPTQGQALAVASAMIREFSKALGSFSGSQQGTPTYLTVTTLQAPRVHAVHRPCPWPRPVPRRRVRPRPGVTPERDPPAPLRLGFACLWAPDPEAMWSCIPWQLRAALRRTADLVDVGVTLPPPVRHLLRGLHARWWDGRLRSTWNTSFVTTTMARAAISRTARRSGCEAVVEITDMAPVRSLPYFVFHDLSFDLLLERYDRAAGTGPYLEGVPLATVERWRRRQHRILSEAAGVFAMSKWLADDLVVNTGLAAERVHVVHPGAAETPLR